MAKFLTYTRNKKRKGFTLVELVVVIAILLALGVGAVMALGGMADTAERAALTSDANTAVRSLNLFNTLADSTRRITNVDTHPGTNGRSGDTLTLGLSAPPDLIDADMSVTFGQGRGAQLFVGVGATGAIVQYDAARGWHIIEANLP